METVAAEWCLGCIMTAAQDLNKEEIKNWTSNGELLVTLFHDSPDPTFVAKDENMDARGLKNLEQELEAAIAAKLAEMRLPLQPSRRTLHLMAKAAATVYEAALENAGEA